MLLLMTHLVSHQQASKQSGRHAHAYKYKIREKKSPSVVHSPQRTQGPLLCYIKEYSLCSVRTLQANAGR